MFPADELIGPLAFHPDTGGVVVREGQTDAEAFARAEQTELRRRIRQAQSERRRVFAALGWWENWPPIPPLLRETDTPSDDSRKSFPRSGRGSIRSRMNSASNRKTASVPA